MKNQFVKNATRLRRINWLQCTNEYKCKCNNRYHKLTCRIPSGSNKQTNDECNDITNASKDPNDECHDIANKSRQFQNDGSTDVINQSTTR